MQCKRYYCGKSLHQTADSKLSVACSGKDSVGVCVASCNNEKQKQECARCNNAAKPHTPGDICTYVHQYIYMLRQAKEQWLLTIDEFLWRFYPLSIDYSLYIHYICWDTCVGNMALAHECCFGNSNYNKMKKIEK